MEFQIVIPSLSRTNILKTQTLHTLQRFGIHKSLITIFVVEEELEQYKKEIGEDYKIVVGVKGLVQQREFIENFFPAGTWIVSFDDDIKDIDLDCFPSLKDFINNAFQQCVERKSYLWSVYPVFNPFFRQTKEPLTTTLNICIGAFFGFINRRNDKDLKIQYVVSGIKEDVERTLRYFIKDGIVLRFNRVGFKTKYYGNDGGGLGTLKSRLEKSSEEVQKLAIHFKDYGKIKVRKNGVWEFDLKKLKAPLEKPTLEIKVLPPISPMEFTHLYCLLENITIEIKHGKSGRRGFPKHRATIFGITKGRYNGIVGLSAFTKKHPDIYAELLRIGKLICPFEFNSIFVNKNVVCPKHKDENNCGESLLISFGDYTGGNIVIDEVVYDAFCRPIVFNGSQLEHYNTDNLVGTKYSLVYFNGSYN